MEKQIILQEQDKEGGAYDHVAIEEKGAV